MKDNKPGFFNEYGEAIVFGALGALLFLASLLYDGAAEASVSDNSCAYVIAWENPKTGATGTGRSQFTELHAQNIIDRLNIKFPHLKHWAEPVNCKKPTKEEIKI